MNQRVVDFSLARNGRMLMAMACLVAASAAGGVERILDADFPDPAAYQEDGKTYLYGTSGSGQHVRVLLLEGTGEVRRLADAMPQLAPWIDAEKPNIWAPAVARFGQEYLLFYTARHRDLQRQCIGLAKAVRPEGPFVDAGSAPFVCEASEGGSIDPSVFDNSGKRYLLWKNDGNCCGMATHIYVRRLNSDGTGFDGERLRLLSADRVEEYGIVEAPEMVRWGKHYYLFYSGGRFYDASYHLAYALCAGPTGPCRKQKKLLASEDKLRTQDKRPVRLVGPGSAAMLPQGGRLYVYFHAWRDARAQASGARVLYRGELRKERGRLSIR